MISLKPITQCTREFSRQIRNANRKYFVHSDEISKSDHGEWFERIGYKKHFEFFIIYYESEPIGTISVDSRKDVVEIGNVIIDEKYRGRGFFRQALDIIYLTHPNKKYKLEVLYNNINAIKVYKKLGYKPTTITLWK